MPWPLPQLDGMSPAVRGLTAHWSTTSGSLPRVLRILGQSHRWLFALVRVHALAQQAPDAATLLAQLEHDLATIVGEPVPRWPSFFARPPKWRHSGAAPVDLDPRCMPLPGLDPTQHLMLTAGLERLEAPTRDAIALLLDTAFGADRLETWGSHAHEIRPGDDVRAEVLAPVMPERLRQRWLDALGLSPPALLDLSLRTDASELVAAAFPCPTRCEHVPFDTVCELGAQAALDLVMSALAVRAALQATGVIATGSSKDAIATAA